VLVALVVAAASSSGSSVGRYQIAATGQNGNGSECFILDTTSGRVWKAYVHPNIKSDDGFFEPKTDEK
jgi:hypothetical protein